MGRILWLVIALVSARPTFASTSAVVLPLHITRAGATTVAACTLIHREDRDDGIRLYFVTAGHLFRTADGERLAQETSIIVGVGDGHTHRRPRGRRAAGRSGRGRGAPPGQRGTNGSRARADWVRAADAGLDSSSAGLRQVGRPVCHSAHGSSAPCSSLAIAMCPDSMVASVRLRPPQPERSEW